MHAKHLIRKSDDAWFDEEGGFRSTLVFLGHTWKRCKQGNKARRERICASSDLCFLYLKTVSIFEPLLFAFSGLSHVVIQRSEVLFNSHDWLTVQVSQLRLGLLRRLCALEDESEAIPGLAARTWLLA